MLVVYYCAVDVSDYIVLSRCTVCSVVMFRGLNFWHNFWRWRQSGIGTAVRIIGVL